MDIPPGTQKQVRSKIILRLDNLPDVLMPWEHRNKVSSRIYGSAHHLARAEFEAVRDSILEML